MLDKNGKKKSRVVVLGATGFIGNAIAKKCLANNLEVIMLSRADIDLENSNAGDKLKKIIKDGDTLVAAAAVAPVKNLEMLTQNLKIVEQIMIAGRSKKLNYFLNISSDAVYQDSDKFLTEKSVRAPLSLHGVMHLARELCFESLMVPIGTLCPTLVYGNDDPHNGYGPNQFSRLARGSEDITLFGKGEELRDHVFIDDVAEVSVMMVEKQINKRINVASGEVHSFDTIAAACLKKCDSKKNIKFKKRTGPMPHNGYRAFDITKLKLTFPSFTPTKLSDGLEQLFN